MKKTHGTVELGRDRRDRPAIVVKCQPHIRMRLKAVFPKISKNDFAAIPIGLSPQSARDIEWFCERYPLDMTDDVRRELRKLSRDYTRRLERLEGLMAPGHVPAIHTPLSKPLRSYQAQAVSVFLESRGLLLGDDLGLGKTVSAMGAIAAGGSLPALVVCPVHLCRQWQSMLGEFLPLLNVHIVKQTKAYSLPDADVIILSYSKLAAWADRFSGEGAYRFAMVVFDECQDLRHNGTQRWNGAKAVADASGGRMGLSATPIYNYGGEIFNILEVIAPGRLGTREEFYREWCRSLGNDKWAIEDAYAFGLYLREEFLMLRRTRYEVGMELPAVERVVTTLPHDAEALKAIEGDATELARLVLSGTFLQSGEAARQFDIRMRQATGIAKAPYVADFVRMLVENGEKVLLFGWHREVYDVWMEKLKDLKPVLYTGTESAAQKHRNATEFACGSRVMIMSLRSGLGLDGLQQYSRTAVFGELDWSPGVHEQCIGRLNRDGRGAASGAPSTGPKGGGVVTGAEKSTGVLAYYLISDAGSDPVMASILGLKRAQHSGVMDLVPGGEVQDGKSVWGSTEGGDRIKELARAYLEKRGVAVPARMAEERVEPPDVQGAVRY